MTLGRSDYLRKETFSEFLIKKRDSIPINNSQLAKKASITSVYLGELIKNKKKPPDKKTQYKLAEALDLKKTDWFKLFDLAAKERDEIPVDVYDYIVNNSDIITEIRDRMKNM